MRERTINDLMDEFYTIVRTAPTEDATLRLVRHAGTAGNAEAIEALSRLLVIEYTRRYRERRRLERDGEGVTEEDGNVTGVTTHNVTGVTRNAT